MAEINCSYCEKDFSDWKSYFDHLNSEHPKWKEYNKTNNNNLEAVSALLHKR